MPSHLGTCENEDAYHPVFYLECHHVSGHIGITMGVNPTVHAQSLAHHST